MTRTSGEPLLPTMMTEEAKSKKPKKKVLVVGAGAAGEKLPSSSLPLSFSLPLCHYLKELCESYEMLKLNYSYIDRNVMRPALERASGKV